MERLETGEWTRWDPMGPHGTHEALRDSWAHGRPWASVCGHGLSSFARTNVITVGGVQCQVNAPEVAVVVLLLLLLILNKMQLMRRQVASTATATAAR